MSAPCIVILPPCIKREVHPPCMASPLPEGLECHCRWDGTRIIASVWRPRRGAT